MMIEWWKTGGLQLGGGGIYTEGASYTIMKGEGGGQVDNTCCH